MIKGGSHFILDEILIERNQGLFRDKTLNFEAIYSQNIRDTGLGASRR